MPYLSGILLCLVHRDLKINPLLSKYLFYSITICYAFYWYKIITVMPWLYLRNYNLPLIGAILMLDIETKHENYVAKVFSIRPISFLGDISFSMYLVQFRVISHFRKWYVSLKSHALVAKFIGFHWVTIFVTILTILVSFFTEKIIE